MLGVAELRTAVDQITPQTYTRNVFRCVELNALLSFFPPQPLFDLGSRISGQRFTPIGGPRALYVTEEPATAYFEANQMFTSVRTNALQQAPPSVILNIMVNITTVLDLTERDTQSQLGTTVIELTNDWQWQMINNVTPPTHTLAEIVFDSGRFQAIRYPSALNLEQSNLIIWTDLLTNLSVVQVIDPSGRFADRLP